MTAFGRERGREHRSQRRHRSVHQPRQSGLYNLQYKQTALGFFLRLLYGQRNALLHRSGGYLMLALDLFQISQQLTNARIRYLTDRLLIELASFQFHELRLLPHLGDF